MRALIFVIISLLCFNVNAQIITTIAGGGSNGLGDGGPADSAQIGYFSGMAYDNEGNLFIADGNHNRVRMVNPNGIITTYAGNGTAGFSGDSGLAVNAELNGPTWVVCDSIGNVYITDAGNKRIRKVNRQDGVINTIAGDGNTAFNGDNIPATQASIAPQDILFYNGELYIADGGNQRVRKVDSVGMITTIAGIGVVGYSGDGGPATSAQIRSAYGMCTDKNGNIYVADWADSRVRRINRADGIITTIAGSGSNVYNGDTIPATSANIGPFDIVVDRYNNLYIADYKNSRIRLVDTTDTIYTVVATGVPGFSGDGGLAISAEINRPEGVVFDSCWNLYIADFNNQRVRKVIFNPNCNQIDTTTSVLAVGATSTLSIFPNPATDQLTITGGSGAEQLTIINAIGQLITQHNCTGRKTTINISTLSPGLYYILIKDPTTAQTERLKFLKE